MSATILDCGCYIDTNGRTLCPSCSAMDKPRCSSCARLSARVAEIEAALRRKVQYLVTLRALKAVTGPTIDAEIESATRLL